MSKTVSHVPPGTRPYFPELDGVRAIAALMIIAFHFLQVRWPHRIIIFGQTGVDLFFVLSGFLITTILLQAAHGDWHEVRNFYIRRVLRIFPLYYGYLILATVLGVSISVWYWFYLENFPISVVQPTYAEPGYFWSLAVEEQFYLFWPFLILFLPRRWLGHAMWGAVALAIALRFVLVHTRVDPFYLTFTRLDGLAGGGLLALYRSRGSLARQRWRLVALAAFSAALLCLGLAGSRQHGAPWVQELKLTGTTGYYASLMGLLLVTGGTFIHAFLRSRPMRAIGRVSYGMYVWHSPVVTLADKPIKHWPLLLQLVICVAAVYAFSWLSFYAYEKPFSDLKQRFAPEKKFRDVHRSAPAVQETPT